MKFRDHPLEFKRGLAHFGGDVRGVYVDNVRLRATTWIPRSPRLSSSASSVGHHSTAAASAKEALRSAARRQH
jgi:hypothetical protein